MQLLEMKKWNKLLLFLLLFLTSSFVVTNDIISSAITIILWIVCLFVLLLKQSKVDLKLTIVFSIISILMGISYVANSETIRVYVVLLFSYFTVLVYVSQVGFEDFKDDYICVMRCLSIISLVGFVLYILFPRLNNLFVVSNAVGNKYSCLIVYVNTTRYTRNLGMFWEPGAFQTFINLAMLFSLSKEKIDVKEIVLFTVTCLTTYSTTAYIALVLLFLLFYTNRGAVKKQRIAITFVVLLVLGIAWFRRDVLIGASLSNGQSTVFGKVSGFLSGNQNANSASVRYFSFTKPIKAFLDSPIYGNGYDGLIRKTYSFTRGMNTCTFINWFAVYGAFFGTIMIVGYINLSRKLGNNYLSRIVIFIILFVITATENYVNNAIMVILALYGYSIMFSHDLANRKEIRA